MARIALWRSGLLASDRAQKLPGRGAGTRLGEAWDERIRRSQKESEHLEFFFIIYHHRPWCGFFSQFFSIFLNLSLYITLKGGMISMKNIPSQMAQHFPAFSKVLMTCTPSASACFASPTSQPTSERCWRFPAPSGWGSIYPLRRWHVTWSSDFSDFQRLHDDNLMIIWW